MPNEYKLSLVQALASRFGELRRLPGSNSLFAIGQYEARVYLRYSRAYMIVVRRSSAFVKLILHNLTGIIPSFASLLMTARHRSSFLMPTLKEFCGNRHWRLMVSTRFRLSPRVALASFIFPVSVGLMSMAMVASTRWRSE